MVETTTGAATPRAVIAGATTVRLSCFSDFEAIPFFAFAVLTIALPPFSIFSIFLIFSSFAGCLKLEPDLAVGLRGDLDAGLTVAFTADVLAVFANVLAIGFEIGFGIGFGIGF